MTPEFLKDIASDRLPRITYRPKEIRAIKALIDAQLVIGMVSERDGYGEIPYAQVIAITEEGRRKLLIGEEAPLPTQPALRSQLFTLVEERKLARSSPTV
jgi:hypothetical protein